MLTVPDIKGNPLFDGLNGNDARTYYLDWSEEQRMAFHELAARLEYECGLTRAAANVEAFRRLTVQAGPCSRYQQR